MAVFPCFDEDFFFLYFIIGTGMISSGCVVIDAFASSADV